MLKTQHSTSHLEGMFGSLHSITYQLHVKEKIGNTSPKKHSIASASEQKLSPLTNSLYMLPAGKSQIFWYV